MNISQKKSLISESLKSSSSSSVALKNLDYNDRPKTSIDTKTEHLYISNKDVKNELTTGISSNIEKFEEQAKIILSRLHRSKSLGSEVVFSKRNRTQSIFPVLNCNNEFKDLKCNKI